MSKDFRILNGGHRLDFTCENRRYRTNIQKGNPHSPLSSHLGNVFNEPLYNGGNVSLWLEHAIDNLGSSECYWLMWYDNTTGQPTIPLSGALNKDEVINMQRLFAGFIP